MPFTFKASNTKAEIVTIKKQKQSEIVKVLKWERIIVRRLLALSVTMRRL